MGETLRLELAPFEMRVVTVVTGAVESNVMSHADNFFLPEDSSYRPLTKTVEQVAKGKSINGWMNADIYAQKVATDITSGANGKIWRGYMASSVRYILTKLPTFLVVSVPLLREGKID